eukprot:12337664-Karenia_brevis.AAC.1
MGGAAASSGAPISSMDSSMHLTSPRPGCWRNKCSSFAGEKVESCCRHMGGHFWQDLSCRGN